MKQISKEEIEKLGNALKKADDVARGLSDFPDGGSANFDHPTITLEGWPIDAIRSVAGNFIGKKMASRYWRGSREVNTFRNGIGARNTKQAEVVVKILKDEGFHASVFYMVD